jgi:protein TonB
MIATIDPVRDVPPPPPPEIPVTIAQPKTTAVPMIKPEIIIPEKETVVADIGPAEVEPVQTAPPETASGSGTGTGTGTAIAPAVRITALQYRAVRPADDYYPPQSLRLEEEGTAIVQVCVAPSGKLEGAPVIQESSGSPRLDEGALKWAREALRFTPATRDGVPVSACKGFRVNFRVH